MSKLYFKQIIYFFLRILTASILTLFTLLQNSFANTNPQYKELPDLVEKVLPSVVNISSTRVIRGFVLRGMPEFFGMFGIPQEMLQRQSTLGTGFIIDKNGYILSNNHVIENASEIIVTLWDKRKIKAKIIGKDKLYDLALLQLETAEKTPNLIPAKLGDSNKVRIAEPVFAIGNPFGLQHTVTSGIISAMNRSIGIGPYDDFLQTDCSINFGNSGGPLFNMQGEVIGINTAINAQAQGIGFAIPINEATENLENLKKFGYIPRSWLGILGETVTPALQAYYNLPTDEGVVIARLVDSGPADVGGLQVGDVITKINDIEIKERADIQKALKKVKPKQSIKITFYRDSKKPITKQILTAKAPESSKIPEGIL
jgi:serine protease Do